MMTDAWVSGARMDGMLHRFPVRVYYEDTDAGGIVYHSRYLNFAERARTEFVRGLGIDQSRLMDEQGLAFAVRRCEVDFLRPARLDDRIEVQSTVTGVGGASMEIRQRLIAVADGTELVHMAVRVACMSVRTGRAARLPADLRETLSAFISEQRV